MAQVSKLWHKANIQQGTAAIQTGDNVRRLYRMKDVSGMHLEPQIPKNNNSDNDDEGDSYYYMYLSSCCILTIYQALF